MNVISKKEPYDAICQQGQLECDL
uniref:Uncharacterized protein n=1 Tax=Anguilla anguilla TaxID=7936 RepID=A0A0E9SI25_ANGAN